MSIKKVATIAGVSIATVSRFFNNPNQVSKATRERVEKAIKRINYSPNTLAQNLRRGKTGLIIAVVHKVSSAAYEPIINQLNQSTKENHYNLLVKETSKEEINLDYYQQMLRCKQADGFIVFTGLPAQTNGLPIEKPLPIVLVCEPHCSESKINLPSIAINDYRAAKEATQYLIRLGHQHIAFAAPKHTQLTMTQRQAGFIHALTRQDLPVFGRLLAQQYEHLPLHQKLHQLLETQPAPTAIFCADDDTAIETIHLLKQKGLKVPQDISVMGFNDIRYARITDPPLTTVALPIESIGTQAIDTLFNLMDSPSHFSQPIILDHKLIIRQSTAPPSA
ncbi:MAG: LacI family transcriptional regulator [Cellvibrionaceae bacterium]|nr:LacI family transcriptional regulator [Cellvibrionaceae bacterium]